MRLPPDLVAVLGALGAEGVRYLTIGGHAVGVHARPRSTKDLDLWLTIPGVTFAAAWPRRVDVEIGGMRVHVIARDDLLANKRATGRPQDRRDARAIERASRRR
jgi:hypothetical protein